jgi:hypothetical protein
MSDGVITVRLNDAKGEPIRVSGVHLDICFYIERRLRYSFSLNRTDAHGISRTSFEEIERQLEANRRLFLMDYNTPLSDCDPLVGIVAPTAADLVEREAARAKWWPDEPPMYVGAANDRVRCPEHKFELCRGNGNEFELVCEMQGSE